MTNTKTTTIHYSRVLVAIAMLTLLASLLVVPVSRPAQAASSSFVVNSTGDLPDSNTSDPLCNVSGGGCTLRAAIQQANATPDADFIFFSFIGDGVTTITPSTPLPAITHTLTIDGYSQNLASPNTLAVGDNAVIKVQLDGVKVPNAHGLEVNTSDGSTIKGLSITRFGTGIAVHGDSVANHIEGNFIGTDFSGTLDQGNHFDGVEVFGGASETVIGGSSAAQRNVISAVTTATASTSRTALASTASRATTSARTRVAPRTSGTG